MQEKYNAIDVICSLHLSLSSSHLPEKLGLLQRGIFKYSATEFFFIGSVILYIILIIIIILIINNTNTFIKDLHICFQSFRVIKVVHVFSAW